MNSLTSYGPLLGRVLIAAIFVLSGISKMSGFESTVGYIASKGLPFASLGAIAAIMVELGGGMMLIVGWKARWAAAAMLIFTVVAAFIFHNFWAAAADQAQNQMIHFMKNISMAGGLLFVIIHGSGAVSIDKQTD